VRVRRRVAAPAYGPGMTHPPSEHEPPVETEGAPAEEEIDEADVADRVDEDPEEQPNRVDPEFAPDEGDPV
jgi:hypothetical protein